MGEQDECEEDFEKDETTDELETETTADKIKLKKTKTYESILSLLVKIYHKNKSTADDSNSNKIITLAFLSPKSHYSTIEEASAAATATTKAADNPFEFETNRIGTENDFIYNLLEKAANSCDKCRLNIEKSLKVLNTTNTDKSTSVETDKTVQQAFWSLSSTDQQQALLLSTSPTRDETNSKKLKAKQRQQRILAQMSNSQQAFLLNPSNKVDVEAYKEAKTTSETALTSQLKAINQQEKSTEAAISDEPRKLSNNNNNNEEEEEYECCICRLPAIDASSSSNVQEDRPLCAVTLLQSTSILGHRESINDSILRTHQLEQEFKRSLPLSDDIDYKQLQSDTMCWKKEKKRVKTLREAFSFDSCRYSVNIGWKGGVYAQMCGHYLHFDCCNSYKKTLDGHLARTSNNVKHLQFYFIFLLNILLIILGFYFSLLIIIIKIIGIFLSVVSSNCQLCVANYIVFGLSERQSVYTF